MRLRPDTIRVEESAACADRLSLHRLPAKRWGALCHLGIRAPRRLVVTNGEARKIAYADRIRSFAACCGTHLFFEDTKDSNMIDVTIDVLELKKAEAGVTCCSLIFTVQRPAARTVNLSVAKK